LDRIFFKLKFSISANSKKTKVYAAYAECSLLESNLKTLASLQLFICWGLFCIIQEMAPSFQNAPPSTQSAPKAV